MHGRGTKIPHMLHGVAKKRKPRPPPHCWPLSFNGIGRKCGPGIHKLKCPLGILLYDHS